MRNFALTCEQTLARIEKKMYNALNNLGGGIMRLNKYLAECGVCSRRKADELIASGKVSVNKKIVKELGATVDETKDVVFVDGRKVLPVTHYEYVMFNKPKGCITFSRATSRDSRWTSSTALARSSSL